MKTVKITTSDDSMIKNGLTGRANRSAFVAVNDNGEYGFLIDGAKPYMPVGGRQALKQAWGSLVFRAYAFSGFKASRPTKL